MTRPQGRSSRRSGGGRVTSTPRSSNPGSVVWWGPFLNNSGYGEEARGFLRALTRRSIHVAARSTGDESSSYVELLEETPDLAIALSEGLNRPVGATPVTAVVHTPGYALRRVPDADFTIGRTMFETDRLPPDWVTQINLLDEVWVPSTFNVDTFTSAGVTVPISVVPSGVDGSAYRPGLKPLPLPGTRGCVFLSVFEWSHRKAPDVLIRAWAEAFEPDDDVTLVLRCYTRARFDGDSSGSVSAMVEAELAALGLSREDVAPIVVMGRQLPASSMPHLLAAADVFVGVSRGEGWGRPLLEAMACGVPTIGTRWGGNLDFMNDDNSLLIEVEDLMPVDDRMDVAFYRGHRWAQPSAGHLAELLRRAAGDPALRRSLGKRARADVERRWQWAQVGATAEARLRDLAARSSRTTGDLHPRAGEAPPLIRWKGDLLADHSLATVNRELVQRLSQSSELEFEATTIEAAHDPGYLVSLHRVGRIGQPVRRRHVSIEIRHAWPPDLSVASEGRLVLIQPWEFGGVPEDWIGPMSTHIDETWVPSTWVRDCYLRSGIPGDRVAVVPNGVDVDTFSPDGTRLPLMTDRSVRLLFVGGTIARKGFDLLLDTYLSVFGPDDDVCLVIKPFGSDSIYQGSSMDERVRAVMSDPRNPAVELVEQRLSREEMAALYRACDVLVHPYRGEGFGLPVAEAMACGVPPLVTGYGACLDFCDDTTGWLVPAREVPLRLPDMTPGPAGFWWAEPDPAVLADLMAHVTTAGEERASKGAAARLRIAGSFTWERAAEVARSRLMSLAHREQTGRPAA